MNRESGIKKLLEELEETQSRLAEIEGSRSWKLIRKLRQLFGKK
jgi:hypothetical protein